MSKLLDNVRNLMRARHYSYKAVKGYVYWIRQYYFLSQCKTSGRDGRGRGGTVLNLFGSRKIGFGFDSKSGLIARLFLYEEVLQVGQKFPFDSHQPGHTIVV